MSSSELRIAAGADAFGDGTHPSTLGALAALDALSHLMGPACALDIGCGSGVLALRMAYQWHIPVIASDIEASAIDATRHNAQTNQLDSLITPVRADGYDHPAIQAAAPFDVICCNWLAEPLIAHAADAAQHCAEEGVLVASGMLRWQSDSVHHAHRLAGFTLLQKITVGDWNTLILQKADA